MIAEILVLEDFRVWFLFSSDLNFLSFPSIFCSFGNLTSRREGGAVDRS